MGRKKGSSVSGMAVQQHTANHGPQGHASAVVKKRTGPLKLAGPEPEPQPTVPTLAQLKRLMQSRSSTPLTGIEEDFWQFYVGLAQLLDVSDDSCVEEMLQHLNGILLQVKEDALRNTTATLSSPPIDLLTPDDLIAWVVGVRSGCDIEAADPSPAAAAGEVMAGDHIRGAQHEHREWRQYVGTATAVHAGSRSSSNGSSGSIHGRGTGSAGGGSADGGSSGQGQNGRTQNDAAHGAHGSHHGGGSAASHSADVSGARMRNMDPVDIAINLKNIDPECPAYAAACMDGGAARNSLESKRLHTAVQAKQTMKFNFRAKEFIPASHRVEDEFHGLTVTNPKVKRPPAGQTRTRRSSWSDEDRYDLDGDLAETDSMWQQPPSPTFQPTWREDSARRAGTQHPNVYHHVDDDEQHHTSGSLDVGATYVNCRPDLLPNRKGKQQREPHYDDGVRLRHVLAQRNRSQQPLDTANLEGSIPQTSSLPSGAVRWQRRLGRNNSNHNTRDAGGSDQAAPDMILNSSAVEGAGSEPGNMTNCDQSGHDSIPGHSQSKFNDQGGQETADGSGSQYHDEYSEKMEALFWMFPAWDYSMLHQLLLVNNGEVSRVVEEICLMESPPFDTHVYAAASASMSGQEEAALQHQHCDGYGASSNVCADDKWHEVPSNNNKRRYASQGTASVEPTKNVVQSGGAQGTSIMNNGPTKMPAGGISTAIRASSSESNQARSSLVPPATGAAAGPGVTAGVSAPGGGVAIPTSVAEALTKGTLKGRSANVQIPTGVAISTATGVAKSPALLQPTLGAHIKHITMSMDKKASQPSNPWAQNMSSSSSSSSSSVDTARGSRAYPGLYYSTQFVNPAQLPGADKGPWMNAMRHKTPSDVIATTVTSSCGITLPPGVTPPPHGVASRVPSVATGRCAVASTGSNKTAVGVKVSGRPNSITAAGPAGPISVAPAPAAVPRVVTGAALSEQYAAARADARDYARLRNQCFQQATQAYLIGNKKLAKELSERGKHWQQLMFDAHQEAAAQLMETRQAVRLVPTTTSGAPPGSGDVTAQDILMLDLHGLHVREALEQLHLYLDGPNTAPTAGDAKARCMHVVVGEGKHSKGTAKTAPARLATAVTQELTRLGIQHRETRPGLLEVRW